MDFIFFLFSHKFFSFCFLGLLFVLSSSFLIIRKVLQRYTFLHKINGNENISVLNFAKSNNLKVLLPNYCYHFIVFFGNRNKAAIHIRVTALNLCYLYNQPAEKDNKGISYHVFPFKSEKVIYLILPNLPRNHRYKEK